MKRMLARSCGFLLFAALLIPGAEPGPLRAGAAKADITPAEDAGLPMGGYAARKHGFERIHDRLHARALVLDDGARRAAILVWELINVPEGVWGELSRRIEKETGIPAGNIFITAVHNHSGVTLRGYGKAREDVSRYTDWVEDISVGLIRKAQANLQPARVGAGTGQAWLNVNRRELNPRTGAWILGKRPDGPCDRSVAVIRFDDMDGKPIAFFINYPVHAVIMGPRSYVLSADLPGATSRVVERFFTDPAKARGDSGVNLQPRPDLVVPGRDVVALWTSGAAGDLNPIALEEGTDFTLVEAMGRILGEEVIRVAGSIETSPRARIAAAHKEVSCPGKRTVTGPDKKVVFEDAEPARLRLSLLTLNDIALAGVSGEVLTMIGKRLKKESPVPRTIMVTHTNGASGYIPDDAAYGQLSYEITATRFKPGCAEDAIVNGFLEMMGKL